LGGSGWAGAHLPHFEVLQSAQVGEEHAEHHHSVPDLVAVPAEVVPSGVVALGTPHRVDVEPAQVGTSQQDIVGQRTKKLKGISVVVVDEFIDHQMGEWEQHGHSETSK
jgi:hypothetical protein